MGMTQTLPDAALAVVARSSEHITVQDGARTVWHIWGSGDPVVLLHGGSGSWTHWIHNIDALVDAGRQVLVPDMPGFGDSDPPAGGRDADALVAPLEAGLRELLGARAFDLVGFSFGGLVGGLIAAQSPPTLRRLVLVGAPLLGVGPRPVPQLEWRHLEAEAAKAAHRTNLLALMLHRPESATPLAIDLHRAHLPLDRLRRRQLARTDTLARALTQVQCSIIALYGRHDALYRDQLPEIEATLDALPALRWRAAIEDAGHWVAFEAPRAFNRELARALA